MALTRAKRLAGAPHGSFRPTEAFRDFACAFTELAHEIAKLATQILLSGRGLGIGCAAGPVAARLARILRRLVAGLAVGVSESVAKPLGKPLTEGRVEGRKGAGSGRHARWRFEWRAGGILLLGAEIFVHQFLLAAGQPLKPFQRLAGEALERSLGRGVGRSQVLQNILKLREHFGRRLARAGA